MILMAKMKMKKFDVLNVPIEVEYVSPVAGRLYGLLAWFMLIRMKKITFTLNEKPIGSVYRLIVPRFVKGGAGVEE